MSVTHSQNSVVMYFRMTENDIASDRFCNQVIKHIKSNFAQVKDQEKATLIFERPSGASFGYILTKSNHEKDSPFEVYAGFFYGNGKFDRQFSTFVMGFNSKAANTHLEKVFSNFNKVRVLNR